ncbi:MAG TPA: PDZ domain-containing protein, partial [Bryobacteraceae bacterium]|nr:PDZ domain-containing protein [Bryobacteraceae bacterium]
MKRLLGAFVACAFLAAAADPPTDQDSREMKRFIDAFQILQQYSADPIDTTQAFYQGAIPGLLRHLDPHSVFFDPDQYGQLKQMETSTRKGFGTVVSILPGRVLVLQTLPNTPSAKAGMMPGDEIVAVNNYRLDRLELDQIVELLNESKQKPARLVVHHPGNMRLTELTLIPEDMQSSSVERAFEL